MQQFEEKLLCISDKVNDWLKFAEAKNGALLVFSGAAITAILSFLGSSYHILPNWKTGLCAGIVLLSISCLLSILSFIPRTKIFFKHRGAPVDTDNFYFYGNLSKYSPQQLIKAISNHYYDDNNNELTRSNIDLAAQIVINSGIAVDKFHFFKVSVWVVLASLVSIPLVSLFMLL
ncbi:hypothetical protein A8990_118113 [Paenibacillus taihuensis]|uniref:Pycsar effector protein domain-containing protein n=1 Tax=Paenibacillus taihuensis TaxID=1156355 RepID=A0A3D9RP49_9BACL|nr:Pycsar system effector family protein [Paenibacillus taihuensis]REE81587.1 hypothetical protein A8990_118113 [Paenibacillus taihuensis]